MKPSNSWGWKGPLGSLSPIPILLSFSLCHFALLPFPPQQQKTWHCAMLCFLPTVDGDFSCRLKHSPFEALAMKHIVSGMLKAYPRVVLSEKNSHITPISIYSCLLIFDREKVEKLYLPSRFSCCPLYKLVSLLNNPVSSVQLLLLDPGSLIQGAGNFNSLSSFYHLVICYNNIVLVKTQLMLRHNFNWHWVSCVTWGERRIFFHIVSLKCYYVLILPLPSIYRYCIKPGNKCAFLSFEDFMLGVCELFSLLVVMIQEILF